MKVGDIVKSPKGQLFEIIEIKNDNMVEIKPIIQDNGFLSGLLGGLAEYATFSMTVSIDQLEMQNLTASSDVCDVAV